MKISVSEATGIVLDYMVAKCEEVEVRWSAAHEQLLQVGYHYAVWQPHKNWTQGGPIIERECITVSALYAQKSPPSPEYDHGEWGAYIPCGISSKAAGKGNTPLIAAMRCYVASKLGETVDVPEGMVS